MGGVINIITKAPTNRRVAFAEVSVGNLATQRYALGLKTPLVKNELFLGATGLLSQREGFLQNDTTGVGFPVVGDADGARVGDETSSYGNVYLKWLPSAFFGATLNLKAQHDNSDASGFFVGADDEVTAFANPDRINLGRVGTHERTIWNAALSLDYFMPALKLSSISTYQSIDFVFEDVESGGVFFSFSDGELGKGAAPQQVWSQELQVSSLDQSAPLRYTAGVNVFRQNGFEPTTNLASLGGPDTYAIFRNEAENSGIAAFRQATYALTSALDATVGLRYDVENRENTFNGFGDRIFSGGVETILRPDTTVSGDYTALSAKMALAYQLTERASVYTSYTRGFRAGGINAQRLPEAIQVTYDPEYSDNFEVGYKSSLWERRLYLSATAFLISWTDLQFFNLVAPPFTFARENVGDAQSYGLELEASILPIDNLRINASLGLNETEYDDFTLARLDATFAPITTEIGGNRLSNAPRSTLYLAGEYRIPMTVDVSLILRGEVRSIGSFYTDIQNDLEQEAYQVVNTRVGVILVHGLMSFSGSKT